ncbi:MAG: hypothetical protein CMJ90_00495 [Planctomycetes bacterium]|nr:hypothetical protein [Planctomycetota bacterium]
MRNGKRVAAWVMVAVTCLGVLALPGCGGGGAGGGDPELPNFLALSGTVFFGFTNGGQETLQQFPTLPSNPGSSQPPVPVPLNGAVNVAGAEFAVGATGQQDFIQLTFNIPLDATSVFPNSGTTSNGIAVFQNSQDAAGNFTSVPVPFVLDGTGAVAGGNAFPGPDIAPAVLRIYYDPDGDLSTADTMSQGSYSVVISENLTGFNGGGFCSNPGANNCSTSNSYLPELSFNIGDDSTSLSVKGGSTGVGASNVTQGDPEVPINTEIELRFNKAVSFDTLVDPVNLSTMDPFVTQPFTFLLPQGVAAGPPWNCQAGGGTGAAYGLDIGNLYVGYNAPIDAASGLADLPPMELGCIVYMPDPILNPTIVRIRFVDASAAPVGTTPGTGTQLNGIDDPTGAITGTVQYQNYASNALKLPINSSDPSWVGGALQLPAARVVPGSLPGYSPALGFADPAAASIDVVLASAVFADPSGNGCSGQTGVPLIDRVTQGGPNQFTFNATAADYHLRFAWAEGPALASNPQPPDATFIGSQIGNLKGIGVMNSATIMSDAFAFGTNTQAPPWAGTQPIGTVGLIPNRLTNQSVLGTPTDMAVGHWLLTLQQQQSVGSNSIANPGRGPSNIAGVPDTQNGISPEGLLCITGAAGPPCPAVGGNIPPVQPLGNFLYVIDGDTHSVKVFNGYNFQLLSSLQGAGAEPGGLAISPDLEYLYVSDFLGSIVRRFYSNPVGPNFHSLATTIPIQGSGPRRISVQPGNEDLIVCNYGDNSFSLIDANQSSERERFADPGAVGPEDVYITNRMLGGGLTGAYTAFIINKFSANVTIYESDSPAVPENGLTGVIKSTFSGFAGPQGGCWNWQTFIGATTEPGCFIANGGASRVDELTLENFTLGPPPGFPGPPGQRNFRIQKSYVGGLVGSEILANENPSDVTIDGMSGLYNVLAVGTNNNKALCDPALGLGAPTFVLVSYPSAGLVGVWNYGNPSLRSTASIPGCDFMEAYYDQ